MEQGVTWKAEQGWDSKPYVVGSPQAFWAPVQEAEAPGQTRQ